MSVFINACCLLSALPSLSQFGQGRLSLVAISFYALLLPFGPCRLSEFTLAGPPWSLKDHLNFFTLKQNLCLQQHDNSINNNVQHSNSESRNSPRSDMQKVESTSLPFANFFLTS